MRVHLIAVGGAVMHNMALALHHKGYKVSGSDDEIFNPAKDRLDKAGLLPHSWGWNPDKIDNSIDVIILGMHAKADNPELIKAQELGIPIYSFPEYIYENSKEKLRVVIGGSHGKTTTTSMIMHILREAGIDFDYMVGAQIEGFDTMVKLSHDAPIIILEGDEYLSSPIDRRPKFHLYHPHIAVLTGVAWDHINVFPTFENYCEQFKIFADLIEPKGSLIYYAQDQELQKLGENAREDLNVIPYNTHPHTIKENTTSLLTKDDHEVPIQVFGNHNLQNIQAAYEVCKQLSMSDEVFYKAISTFGGAAKRLQLLKKNNQASVYLDFAHSPSKLKATVSAVKDQYANRKLIACMELHTFSSLNENFLNEYKGAMDKADLAIVYYNEHVLQHKNLPDLQPEFVKSSFGGNVEIMTKPEEIKDFLNSLELLDTNLLLMSSGNFSGIDFKELAEDLIH